MQQPQLGMKVAELRQLKTMTQEELAERCDVSARTIQRIESGEVDPRAFTVRCLGEALDFDFEGQPPGGENLWLVVLHLSSCLCLVVVPLLLWSAKKATSARIDRQGRQVLNFQITMALVLLTGGAVLLGLPLALLLLGLFGGSGAENGPLAGAALVVTPLPMIAVGLFCTYQGVVNAVRAVADGPVHYPLSITFVK
jgi:uncharacterized Tic20 family protein/DNA-binding XRE family transcriptional regulator